MSRVVNGLRGALVVANLVGAGVVAIVPAAHAQVTPGSPGQAVPKDTLPRQPNPAVPADETLSDKLHRTDGVIAPPATATDEGIHKPAPSPNIDPEVVVPPGGTNNQPEVRPK
jgi:hypothetical protein